MNAAGIDDGYQSHAENEDAGRLRKLIEQIVQPIGRTEEQRAADLECLDTWRQPGALLGVATQGAIVTIFVQLLDARTDFNGVCHAEHEDESRHDQPNLDRYREIEKYRQAESQKKYQSVAFRRR